MPHVDFDPDWRSPCEIGDVDAEGRISWQIALQSDTSFARLEHALNITLHVDIKTYYSQFWFPSLGAMSPDGDLDLIGLWNIEDFERLQANLIGHAMQQQKRKLSLAIFFATTLPDNDYCLAVDNRSGEVVLERPGCVPERIIAPTLKDFLETLTPRFSLKTSGYEG